MHGTDNPSQLRKPGNDLCITCHTANGRNGPRAATLEAHMHHKDGAPAANCAIAITPKIETTIADVTVRAHTFEFITPAMTCINTINLNACTSCHTR